MSRVHALLVPIIIGQLRDMLRQGAGGDVSQCRVLSTDRMLARSARQTSVSAAVGPE